MTDDDIQLLIWLIVLVMMIIGGWQKARNYEKANGRTPWNMSPPAWGLLWGFCGLLIGYILWQRAVRKLEKTPRPAITYAPSPSQQTPQYGGDPRFAATPTITPRADERFRGSI